MRISSVAATAALHAETSTDVAAQADHPVASATQDAHVATSPFAVLGEPLFGARSVLAYDNPHVASAESASSAANPQRVVQRHGIIVIGGSEARTAASTARDAIEQGPTLQGIIIVGGSTPGHPLPKVSIGDRQPLPAAQDLTAEDRMGNFEIQRLMSAFNQAETLSSNMQKKLDDTISGVAQKIG